MRLLAFDTASPLIQVAVLKDRDLLFEEKLAPQDRSRQESASQLIPALDRALKESGLAKSELDLIVVGVGPGSFTGVRVAVVTARTLGQALKLGVVPVSSLEILSSKLAQKSAILLSAGGGKYYAAAYDQGQFSNELLAPICGSLEEIQTYIEEIESLACESGLKLPEAFLEGKKELDLPGDFNYALGAAELALKRIEKSGLKTSRDSLAAAYPWDNVLPLYLRSPSVTLKTNGSSDKTPSH